MKGKRYKKRIGRLIIMLVLTAVLVSVSTYAWFIGMRTVNVNTFDVEIASADSLSLSLDGLAWGNTVDINGDNFSTASYLGNTNTWGMGGLKPVSTVGKIDTTSSKLIMYEKASLTATPGGYRLMSSRIPNTGAEEVGGYVAFDLFVKNYSGRQYLERLQPLDEEAIYLTVDSEVAVSTDGGVPDTGIENSVRVAFAEIGRVSGDTTAQEKITAITCATDATEGYTGICRDAQIWEPNDTAHEQNAINFYQTACKKRTAADLTLEASYSGTCGTVTNGLTYKTYAINTLIDSVDRVDVYDGAQYNGYSATTKLSEFGYFTDTMKYQASTIRPTFITLAPNSITKIRVYIYLEGQDIDNYDFASIGRKISVKFGFTKQRITEGDVNYVDPELNQGEGPDGDDLTPPVITLLGANPFRLTLGTDYVDPGFTATDAGDDLTLDVKVIGNVNKNVIGNYTLVYKVEDSEGNVGTKTRLVIVEE